MEQEEEKKLDDSLLRKVASNPDLHTTDSSPIRVSEHYTPTKSIPHS